MADPSSEADGLCCPYIDMDDARCRRRFRLQSLHEAFELCCGGHRGCATYYQIRNEQSGRCEPIPIYVSARKRTPAPNEVPGRPAAFVESVEPAGPLGPVQARSDSGRASARFPSRTAS